MPTRIPSPAAGSVALLLIVAPLDLGACNSYAYESARTDSGPCAVRDVACPADASVEDGGVADSAVDGGELGAEAGGDAGEAGPVCACSADKPVCIAETAECVACTAEEPTACVGDTPVCDGARNTCVACVAQSDCTSELSPVCGAGQRCGPCTEDAQCARVGKVCDEPSGSCVGCTLDSERVQCGTKSCNPASHTCTQTERGSVNECLSCVADSECSTDDYRCIAMFFGAEPSKSALGGRCIKRLATGCARPYGGLPIVRASLSGAAAEEYCGIAEDRTSCEAILALGQSDQCPSGTSAECNAPGAVCGKVNGVANVCSYACAQSLECPIGIACPTSGSDKYCGK